MDKVEEGTHLPMNSRGQSDILSQLDRVMCEFREDLEHVTGRRLYLLGNMNRLSSDREKDREEYAFSQHTNEWEQLYPRRADESSSDYLSASRGDIRTSDMG